MSARRLRRAEIGVQPKALSIPGAARRGSQTTQSAVARRLGRPQSYVSKYETGERRLDVVEFLEVMRALRVNPVAIISALES
jgi:transcriptional regulator with XRE-family HTH domain